MAGAGTPKWRQRWQSLVGAARNELGLTAALLVLASGVLTFLRLADEVRETETTRFDLRVLMALRQPGDPNLPLGPHWLRTAAADVTALGSTTDLTLIVLITAGLFIGLRRWREALILVMASGGGVALSQGLKALFGRERPPAAYHAVEVINASFPSGHAMLSAVVYLTLAVLIARFAQHRRVKAYAMATGLILTLLVGTSRVYLGVHWPTDVMGGWVLGAAWAMLWWVIAWYADRRWPALRAEHAGTSAS